MAANANVYVQEDPIQGWGYDPQGQGQFSTVYGAYPPSYRAAQARNDPYPEESLFEDSDDGQVDPFDAIYGDLDLSHVHGQQLAIWTHKNPDTLSLFTPIPGDTFVNIVTFARTTLQFNSAVDKIMVLLPGYKRPLDMDHVFVIKPGTSILIAPLYDYMISLEVKQLGHRIDMVVNLTMTVLDLKMRLQTERGYPSDRMELLYKDRPMENNRYLFEYSLAHNATLFVLMTLKYDVLIHVETFWGKRYHLHVDTCSTGFSVIASILRRTVSQVLVDVVRLYDLFLPKHTLVLYLGSRALDWDTCLGFYEIDSGSVLRLATIGLAHDMDIQKVPVLLDSGKPHNILVSKFDRWSAVVLKLHGMTGYPVNLMRLVRNSNHTVDFSDTVGSIQAQGGHPVRLDVSGITVDEDLLYGIPLKFKVASGVTELLKVAPSRTIKSVKDTLERVGVPNAALHDLEIDEVKLPNNKRVVDVVEEYKKPINLVLRQYPVFIHGPQNVIYKMLANRKETLATFLMRIKMKTGLSFQDYTMLTCGTLLDDDENLPVFDTRVSIKSSIFLIPQKRNRVFLILHNDWLTKVRLPATANQLQIKEALWKDRNVPEGALASIANFFQWFFGAPSQAESKSGLKDDMITYEQSVRDKYLTMRVEKPKRNRKQQDLINDRLEELELEMEDLYPLPERRTNGRHRASSQPPENLRSTRSRIPVPRHMSAADYQLVERHYPKRKAMTTMPVDRPPRRKPRKKRRQAPNLKQLQEYDTSHAEVAYPRERVQGTAKGNDDEYVFCLRHDYRVKGDKREKRHKYD